MYGLCGRSTCSVLLVFLHVVFVKNKVDKTRQIGVLICCREEFIRPICRSAQKRLFMGKVLWQVDRLVKVFKRSAS